ncbi:TolC family protein [Chitinophaga nivalis]|uniref:TolC family protein n=1 Tax=Chitinophaga nivalis TaxID=2991709 RepID=A0ABT3IL48_9BACT|nr:TolC family protein [Chitinophaga nivalis]MCW3465633.1 TolC family protein [Chitinophaga nivalis]MCW3484676.1 TolC family protein [Chitinophaga nivalis]
MNVRFLIGLLFPFTAFAQSQPLTMEGAVQQALQQNKGLKSASVAVGYYKELVRTSGELAKTDVNLQYGQTNSYVQDNNFSVSQAIPFPTVFGARKQLNQVQVDKAVWWKAVTQNDLVYQVKQTYVQLLYYKELRVLLQHQDSLFSDFVRTATLRYKTGESRMLEKTAAEGRMNEIRNLLRQNEADEQIYLSRLQALLGTTEPVSLAASGIPAVTIPALNDTAAVAANPQLQYLRQQVLLAEKQKQLFRASILPDITVGYFNQSLVGTPANAAGALATSGTRFQGFQVGLALPLWMGPLKAKVRAEEKQQQAAALQYDNSMITLQSQYGQAVQQFIKQRNSLDYYQTTALPNAALLLQQSAKSYSSGDIGYPEYFLNLEQALTVREGYLKTRNDAKQAELYIAYLAAHQL